VLKLSRLFATRIATQKHLWQLQNEVEHLRKENASLRAQNDSMRAGMRRCVTCEYRIDYKQRQGRDAPAVQQPPAAGDDS
jgi:cell division protein FtsB